MASLTYVYGEHRFWQRAALDLARRLQHEGGTMFVDGEPLTPAEFIVETRRAIRAHRRVVEEEVDALMRSFHAEDDDGDG